MPNTPVRELRKQVKAAFEEVGQEPPESYRAFTGPQCLEALDSLTAPEAPAAPVDGEVLETKKAKAERELDAWIAAHPELIDGRHKSGAIDISTTLGRATAKRRKAAFDAIATMRTNGTLPAASERTPVDPAASARAHKAVATRRANQAAAQAAKAAEG